MKELSIEEKAKRYDEAIEKFDVILNLNTVKESGTIFADDVRKILPELKESEDEKIRKALIEYYSFDKDGGSHALDNITPKQIVAWLEKQGEQKPANKVEPKFHEGEWITNGDYTWKIVEVKPLDYILQSQDGNIVDDTIFHVDEQFHSFTIKDAKDGDLIYVSTEERGIQAIFHEYKNNTIFFHCYLCVDFVQGGYMPIGSVELVYPLQKTHYNRFFEKMHEAGYEWDAEKKELKKIEMNPAWSEEDEEYVNSLLKRLEGLCCNKFATTRFAINEDETWLKSLKERYTWKPSDEQMKALKEACDEHWEPDGLDPLYMLWEQLKKLREE